VFEMLHRLGNERIKVTGGTDSTVEMLAVRGASGLALMVYNHNIPGGGIRDEEVLITMKGMTPANPITAARVDGQNANPKQKWIDLGSPEYPTVQELAQIEQASQIVYDVLNFEQNPDGCTFRFVIPAHGVAVVLVQNITQ